MDNTVIIALITAAGPLLIAATALAVNYRGFLLISRSVGGAEGPGRAEVNGSEFKT
ncbi:MAG TPA: hypothetical protein VG273_08635 [Bryobacteraceae bacterium]|jgi:hypothetical protein|nr:hypothetical protein [Bryobacteraceae bacterium]